MKAVVFTPSALFRLSQFSITDEWFHNFGIPEKKSPFKRIQIGEITYIIEKDLDDDNIRIVVINLQPEAKIFSAENIRANTLDRIITVAHSVFSSTVVIPTSWRQHHEGSLLSIQSNSKDWRSRLHFEMHPNGSDDLFTFSRTEEMVNFNELVRYSEIHTAARSTLADAILTPPQESAPETLAGITLSKRLSQGFVHGASLDDWYNSKLTSDQRSFVDKPHDGPVRLRGSAGTGKTLSLVIKCFRDAINAEKNAKPAKYGFITHSAASVDLVYAIGETFDSEDLLIDGGKSCQLEVRTLYDLAHTYLHFDLDQLKPLSLDGREGRKLQFELIESVLRESFNSSILKAQFSEISEQLLSGWHSVGEATNTRLVSDIMNEFASVLDADSIRAGEELGEKYAKGGRSRPSWLMPLPNEIDRRFILEIHRRYRILLDDMNALSVDQMIGDFNSFLNSNRWDKIRKRAGYDALFVDELHLFTSIERQTLHKLIRNNVEEDGIPRRPPIFMAYDLKQSPRDTFTQYSEADNNLFGTSSGLQNSELVKLDRVFRYTPQIAEFLADLDATFPAIDVPGEWDAYAGTAELADGNVPELVVFKDEKSLFVNIMALAERTARLIDGGGRRVAVLCASEEKFDQYVKAASGQFPGNHIAITSRDPISELRHAGKRFILSMPEYVAGLQFDTVFLVNVDAQEAPTDAGDGIRRRFISNIYLGSSRAEKTLKISACATRGGMSDVLQMAVDRQSLKLVAAPT